MSYPASSLASYFVSRSDCLVYREVNPIEVSSSFESFSVDSDFLEMESHPVIAIEITIANFVGLSSEIPIRTPLTKKAKGKHQASPEKIEEILETVVVKGTRKGRFPPIANPEYSRPNLAPL
ncbi:hypothetical protein VNO80_01340 [Phaseolus coccineus]|uniref:Uncharacterized protein n=1 Tax=Phaseolus coccineus TaxID=3886 RepID=A0AAN9RSP2_PHACN